MSKVFFFDYLFVLRPLILVPSWNFLLIGSYLARNRSGFTWHIVIGLVIYTCVMGGSYIFNQIMDRETDRINKKLFLIAEGWIQVRHAYAEMVVLWIIALVLSCLVSIPFVIVILISMLLGVLYSLPPVKLKGKPLCDMLANGIGYGMVNCAVGWLLVKPFDGTMVSEFIPYVLSISAVFINTTIVDMEGDKSAGEHTTALVLGPQNAAWLSTLLMTAAIMAALVMKDFVCLIPAAVSLPLYIAVALYSSLNNSVHRTLTIASFRLPGLLFTLIVAFLYPLYFVVLVALFVCMRIYYKKRFGIAYPTLTRG